MKEIMLAVSLTASFAMLSCDKDDDVDYPENPPAQNNLSVQKAAGDSATVVVTMNQFRTVAGDVINTTPGAAGGRREINWDGVADSSAADFFNPTAPEAPAGRKRGLVYFPATTLLRTSVNRFSDIDASYAAQFQPFSKQRLFNAHASNNTEIRFKVAGTNTDAGVRSIGIVFADVDDANSTTVEVFNGNTSLGKVKASASDGKFSFVGVTAITGLITSVRITSGNGVLATGVKDVSDGGNKDLVVMDDFIYSEPVASN